MQYFSCRCTVHWGVQCVWANPVDSEGNELTIGKQEVEQAGRYAHIVADGKGYTTDGDITINVQAESGDSRIYAIAAGDGKDLTLNFEKLDIDMITTESSKPQIRAIRNNGGGHMIFNGNIELTVNGKANGFVNAVDCWDGGYVEFNGESTSLTTYGDGVQVNSIQCVSLNGEETTIVFNSDSTNITNDSNKSGGINWANDFIIEGLNAKVIFNGNEVNLTSINKDYTAQNISLVSGGVVEFNADKTTLRAESDYGVNGIGGTGIAKFNNGIVNIIGEVNTDNGQGTSNAIGIFTGTQVSENVEEFNINIFGAGVESTNDNNTNGTAGIYAHGDDVTVAAKKLNVTVTPKSAHNQIAYGLRADVGAKISVSEDTATTINVGSATGDTSYNEAVGVYAGNFYDKYISVGSVEILGDTTINAYGNTDAKALYASDGGTITVGSEGKTVSLVGDVVAEGENSVIDINAEKLTQNGSIIVSGGEYSGSNLELNADENQLAVYGGTDKAAVIVKDNGSAVFDGKSTIIDVNADHNGKVFGLILNNGAQAEFNADQTKIYVDNVNKVGTWDYAVDVKENSQLDFNGTDVDILANKLGYTSQTFTVRNGSVVNFNNTGVTKISATGDSSVTSLDVKNGGVMNVSSDSFIIHSKINSKNEAAINAIGIQIHSESNQPQTTKLNVTDNVNTFDITVEGQGYDYDGTSYSSGTAALKASDKAAADIKADNFNVNVSFDGTYSGDNNHNIMAGIWTEAGGIIQSSADTVINVTKTGPQAGKAYAVWSTGKDSVITLSGNTEINAYGIEEAVALLAQNGGTITVGSEGKTVSLVGDVVADGNNSVINIAGDSVFNEKDTEFTSTNNGTINLTGGNMSGMLNISEGSTVNLNGATFTTDNIASDITGNGKLVLKDSGVLSTTADQIFTSESGKVTATDEVDGINNTDKVTFESGTVSLNDAEYNLEFLHSAVAEIGSYKYDNTNTSKTGIVMTGDLVGGIEDNKITVDDAASVGDDIALDKVTVEADNNLLVGAVVSGEQKIESITIKDSVTNGFNAGSLDLNASEGTTGMVITNDKNVTLGGSEGGSIITVNGNENATVNVVVGTNSLVDGATSTTGSFTIGNALATSETEYTLNGSVTVNADSNLTTNGQTTITGGVTLNDGNLDAASGALDLTGENNGITATGNSTITGTVNVGTLTGASGAVINVGNSDKAANVVVNKADLKGATVFLDPAWENGTEITDASNMAVETSTELDGNYVVGQNSVLSFGIDNTEKAQEVFAKTGLTWGEDDITAALYIADTVDLTNGSVVVDGSLTEAPTSASADTFTAAEGSVTMIDGSKFAEDGTVAVSAAITGVTTATIDDSAKLYIDNAKKGETYKVINGVDTGWADSNIISDNSLLVFAGDTNADSAFNVTASYDKVDNVYGKGAVVIADVVDKTLEVGKDGDAAYDFFNAAASSKNNATKAAQAAAFNSVANMGEMGGVSHAAYSVSNAMTDAVADHLSIATHGDQDKDIWAHYVHNKENIENIRLGGLSAGYDLQYNGIVVGSDLYKKGKATAGIALSYIEGDVTNSNIASYTKNEAEYYGASVYGRIDNGNSAVLGDITYMHGSSDISQNNSGYKLTADADTDVFSIGVRAEQKIEAGIGQFVPYAGLRYMHLGTGNYANSIGMNYDVDEQNLWLLPVGVTYSCEAQKGGWTIRPVVEAGYVWAMGDRDTNQTVSLNGAANGFGFDTADSGSFVSRFAVEAERANIVYSLGYEYQKGDTVKANKWMANMTWKF